MNNYPEPFYKSFPICFGFYFRLKGSKLQYPKIKFLKETWKRFSKTEVHEALIPNVRISTVSNMKFYLNSGNEIEFK
jgi:hypothetical protein